MYEFIINKINIKFNLLIIYENNSKTIFFLLSFYAGKDWWSIK